MEHALVAGRARPAFGERLRQVLTAIGGTVISFALASLLHFIYKWSGQLRPVAIFASVNESVWEHVKILLWPYLLWSFAVYYILKPDVRRLIAARTAGAYLIGALVIGFFYIYTGILGYNVAWVDILSAAVWLLAGEIVSMRVLNGRWSTRDYYLIALAALVLLVVMLLCFTVSPPHLGLFADPNTGLYGLEVMP
ncbi:MAG: hypothetical protein E7554_00100 [Ruminococcaceae bacterium]|nr:hypothetical protein [Oscillospiraceae bacterium]